MKKNKTGRPLKYPFNRIPEGKCRTIKAENLKSCQRSALIYAANHGLVFETERLETGVRVCDRTECE